LGLFLGAIVIGWTGCELTGGGWIPSLSQDGSKATYGFDVVQPNDFPTTPAFFTGSITFHDRNYLTAAFPNGVNVNASSGLMFAVDAASSPIGVAFAIAAAPCTFAEGGNGGQPGTLVLIGADTGLGGSSKGDVVAFVIYPIQITDPTILIEIGLETALEIFGIIPPDVITLAIYLNENTIGDGGPGGGNVSIDGVPADLGGTWVSLTALATLVAGALWLRLGSRRRNLRASCT
jgi:hypothetical protein